MPWTAIAERHSQLKARESALEAQLSAEAEADTVVQHPQAAAKYRRLVEDLSRALDDPADLEGREGREAVRTLVHEIRVTPAEGHGQYAVEIIGDLAPILHLGAKEKGPLAGAFDCQVMATVGAGTGFEPVTFRL